VDLFDDLKPITLERLNEVWPQLKCDLTAIGFTDLEFVGSTGKKPVMGDVDVAARFEGTTDEAYVKTAQYFTPICVRRVGGNILSIYAWRGHPDPFQVDVMMGDPAYLRWARWGSSQDPNHPDFSPVKSAARNLLLNVITRFISEAQWPMESLLDRARMSIDFDNGLYEVTQTKRGKDGRALKNWKTTYRYFVSNNPNTIVQRLFGKQATAEGTRTFEGVVAALRQSRWKKLAPQIMQAFASEVRDLPQMLGDEPEKTLAYIDTVAASE
jgi:hypothetical protein